HEAVGIVFGGDGVERGHLLTAWHAPRSPEVDEQLLAGEVGDGERLARCIVEGKVGIAAPLARAGQCRELARSGRVDRLPLGLEALALGRLRPRSIANIEGNG